MSYASRDSQYSFNNTFGNTALQSRPLSGLGRLSDVLTTGSTWIDDFTGINPQLKNQNIADAGTKVIGRMNYNKANTYNATANDAAYVIKNYVREMLNNSSSYGFGYYMPLKFIPKKLEADYWKLLNKISGGNPTLGQQIMDEFYWATNDGSLNNALDNPNSMAFNKKSSSTKVAKSKNSEASTPDTSSAGNSKDVSDDDLTDFLFDDSVYTDDNSDNSNNSVTNNYNNLPANQQATTQNDNTIWWIIGGITVVGIIGIVIIKTRKKGKRKK